LRDQMWKKFRTINPRLSVVRGADEVLSTLGEQFCPYMLENSSLVSRVQTGSLLVPAL